MARLTFATEPGDIAAVILYSGGESSRIYDGRYRVRSWFTWPNGRRGEDETEASSYEDCMDWLARAPHNLLTVSDGNQIHHVRVERAVIEEAA